jgi:hypothetical protein
MKERWIRVRGMLKGFAEVWAAVSMDSEDWFDTLCNLADKAAAMVEEVQDVYRYVRRWVAVAVLGAKSLFTRSITNSAGLV